MHRAVIGLRKQPLVARLCGRFRRHEERQWSAHDPPRCPNAYGVPSQLALPRVEASPARRTGAIGVPHLQAGRTLTATSASGVGRSQRLERHPSVVNRVRDSQGGSYLTLCSRGRFRGRQDGQTTVDGLEEAGVGRGRRRDQPPRGGGSFWRVGVVSDPLERAAAGDRELRAEAAGRRHAVAADRGAARGGHGRVRGGARREPRGTAGPSGRARHRRVELGPVALLPTPRHDAEKRPDMRSSRIARTS
jgi:hypothetical protein